jgi:nitrogen-specific signal transduction histidine kinase
MMNPHWGEVSLPPGTSDGRHFVYRVEPRHDGCVEVILEDTGPGIPTGVYERIIEPLYSTKGFGVPYSIVAHRWNTIPLPRRSYTAA